MEPNQASVMPAYQATTTFQSGVIKPRPPILLILSVVAITAVVVVTILYFWGEAIHKETGATMNIENSQMGN